MIQLWPTNRSGSFVANKILVCFWPTNQPLYSYIHDPMVKLWPIRHSMVWSWHINRSMIQSPTTDCAKLIRSCPCEEIQTPLLCISTCKWHFCYLINFTLNKTYSSSGISYLSQSLSGTTMLNFNKLCILNRIFLLYNYSIVLNKNYVCYLQLEYCIRDTYYTKEISFQIFAEKILCAIIFLAKTFV